MSRTTDSRDVEPTTTNPAYDGPLCDYCGSLRSPNASNWHCRTCGSRTLKQDVDAFETTQPQQPRTLTIRSSDTERGLPTTDAPCPECDHDEAYWDIKQLRSSDEAPTELYICTACAHTWRRD